MFREAYVLNPIRARFLPVRSLERGKTREVEKPLLRNGDAS